jgi:hypothetical protein
MRQQIPRRSNLVPSRHILTEVLGWPGVHTERGRFGAIAVYLQRRELGHLHGDRGADLPLPRALRDRLVSGAAARKHRWRPDSGWVTIALDSDRAVFEVLALLRANYERELAASDRRRAASQARLDADEGEPSLGRADVQDGDATGASSSHGVPTDPPGSQCGQPQPDRRAGMQAGGRRTSPITSRSRRGRG